MRKLVSGLLWVICPLVGCSSVFARRFMWPHERVCVPLTMYAEGLPRVEDLR